MADYKLVSLSFCVFVNLKQQLDEVLFLKTLFHEEIVENICILFYFRVQFPRRNVIYSVMVPSL